MTLSTSIGEPNDSDCLFGRGRRFQNHPGNRTLHRLVSEHLADFIAGDHDAKNMLIARVVNIIKQGSGASSQGRFLRRRSISDQGKMKTVWDEASDLDARNKVGHTFRSRIRPQNMSMISRRSSKKAELPPSSSNNSSGISLPMMASLSVKTTNRQAVSNATPPSVRQALIASLLQKEREAALHQYLQSISNAELLRLADRVLVDHGRVPPPPRMLLARMPYPIDLGSRSMVDPFSSASTSGVPAVELLGILESVTQRW